MTLRTNPPRNPSQMGSNSYSGVITGVGLVALLVIGFVVFANLDPAQNNIPTAQAPSPAPITHPQ